MACLSDGQQRADYMQGTRVTFKSKEDAIHFAEKQGTYLFLSYTSMFAHR